jgi:hypothetical protein
MITLTNRGAWLVGVLLLLVASWDPAAGWWLP